MSATATNAGDSPVDSNAVAKALGAVAAAKETESLVTPATEASRFVLQGVVGNASAGSALISVDGKTPKPVRVGDVVAEGWTLHLVEGRRAVLSRNGAELELSLPALSQPATLKRNAP